MITCRIPSGWPLSVTAAPKLSMADRLTFPLLAVAVLVLLLPMVLFVEAFGARPGNDDQSWKDDWRFRTPRR